MSLWTPYVAEAPLDLSKPTVKQEPTTIVTQEYYPQFSGYDTAPYQPYFGYQYQHQQFAPPVQFSPVSGGSSCSAFDTVPPTLSPGYHPIRPVTLSPPESPVSVAEKPSARLSVFTDVDTLSDDPDFQAFERDALRAMAEKNGGSLVGNNPRMRRAVKSTNQDSGDDSYRKQRERNNFAAKQSRDRRKLREIHLALKVAYLKNEIANLKSMVSMKTCVRCHRQGDC